MTKILENVDEWNLRISTVDINLMYIYTRRNGKFENMPHTPKWADEINRLHAGMVTKEKLLTRRNGRFRSQLTRRNGHFEPKATRRTSHFFY